MDRHVTRLRMADFIFGGRSKYKPIPCSMGCGTVATVFTHEYPLCEVCSAVVDDIGKKNSSIDHDAINIAYPSTSKDW